MRWFVGALAIAIMVPIFVANRSRYREPWWL
jgi:hypothetical protein